MAIFPYIILGVLFVRAITLPGSADGVMYLITPQFDQLLNPKVFFSLSIRSVYIINFLYMPYRFGMQPFHKFSSRWPFVSEALSHTHRSINLIRISIGWDLRPYIFHTNV